MSKAKLGRPRSEKSKEAILSATHALLSETMGTGLTIEAIARRAKVGKPTIYRWWPGVADIVLEVVLSQANASITVSTSDSLQETLGQFLRESMNAIVNWGGVHLRFLVAHAQKDEAFRDRFRDNFTAKRRAVLKSIFAQAMERGEIGSEQNVEILVDMVFGAMWYRLLIGHAPANETFADDLTEAIIRLVQNPPV
ncbi:MAG: TetR/AcrR family transcriptional regulator [Pseudodesulfovibrio sp.]|uniref:Regulatory protein TetR n=2 Tax=Pseudodesulfovibrio aespoeensis TaxID=182210 RepID=E6VTI6_PSEA9|nr:MULTISPECIES: TetR/AcrR family transcriptional regulator [Pseudodesulfovibrio]MBU4515370.1 TetR/AcrR family transcriptional regulator [Pseudomonadota bacterium]ADU62163.1 regulatory protein TetR [Pseudodesulfovibrio aespoeensis Aspo-2]MBU4521275.1 TetR/AcrR family transcriptional regulator [Pseudomonadota bacterium]MBU4559481.1 TetR/AcrR family transcriptional regulator [Pseudomonadota bacterium]MBV1764653.1 TetR/AcrR family transcriptional regulator [Pseudodesulfovibrio sp.]